MCSLFIFKVADVGVKHEAPSPRNPCEYLYALYYFTEITKNHWPTYFRW